MLKIINSSDFWLSGYLAESSSILITANCLGIQFFKNQFLFYRQNKWKLNVWEFSRLMLMYNLLAYSILIMAFAFLKWLILVSGAKTKNSFWRNCWMCPDYKGNRQGSLPNLKSLEEQMYYLLNWTSTFPLRRTAAGANQQRVGPQVRIPCAGTLLVLERANYKARQGIHREDRPGKSD